MNTKIGLVFGIISVVAATTITGKLHQQRKSKKPLFFCGKMDSGDEINGKSGGPSDPNAPGRWNDNR